MGRKYFPILRRACLTQPADWIAEPWNKLEAPTEESYELVRDLARREGLLCGPSCGAALHGAIQIATGAWYDPIDPAADSSLDKHGNPNVLTIDKGTSQLGQGPIAHSALVELVLHDGELPDITAHNPPRIVARVHDEVA